MINSWYITHGTSSTTSAYTPYVELDGKFYQYVSMKKERVEIKIVKDKFMFDPKELVIGEIKRHGQSVENSVLK